MLKNLLKNNSGATAIEYALIAALVAVVIITALTFVGGETTDMYSNISSTLGGAFSL